MIIRQIIYDAPQEQFFKDVRSNKLVDIMKTNFKETSGMYTRESEYESWGVTGDKIKNLIELNDKDIENLDDMLPVKLRPFLPSTFSFD